MDAKMRAYLETIGLKPNFVDGTLPGHNWRSAESFQYGLPAPLLETDADGCCTHCDAPYWKGVTTQAEFDAPCPKWSEEDAWQHLLDYSRSPEGMVATHSAKEAWLTKTTTVGLTVEYVGEGKFEAWLNLARFRLQDCYGDSPQAAVEALCQKVLDEI